MFTDQPLRCKNRLKEKLCGACSQRTKLFSNSVHVVGDFELNLTPEMHAPFHINLPHSAVPKDQSKLPCEGSTIFIQIYHAQR